MKHFYDIHCHAFNLSHANLIAITKRVLSKLARISKRKYIRLLFRIFAIIAAIAVSAILIIISLIYTFFPEPVKNWCKNILA